MRKENWPHLLAEKIAACRDREFKYGSFDCCLFAAECVEEITGIDFAKELRGYSSEEEAYAVIARFGSFESMITQLLGDPQPVAFAQRADVVLASLPCEGGQQLEALGICDGVFSWFASPIGLSKFKTLNCHRAWRVS